MLPPWVSAGTPAAENSLMSRTIDLRRRGSPGEDRRWTIRRVNLALDARGRTLTRSVYEGDVDVTLVEETGPGSWSRSVTWARYAVGEAQGDDAVGELIDHPAVVGLSYVVRAPEGESPAEALAIDADFSRAGPGLGANMLRVLALDVNSWTPTIAMLRAGLGDEVRIGDSVCVAPWDIAIELGAGGSSYRLGETVVSVVGLTTVGGEDAALIWFAAEANDVVQAVEMGPARVTVRGVEYFRGTVAVSLTDGRVMAGTLSGPLISQMRMTTPDGSESELPVAATVQEVSFQEVPGPARTGGSGS